MQRVKQTEADKESEAKRKSRNRTKEKKDEFFLSAEKKLKNSSLRFQAVGGFFPRDGAADERIPDESGASAAVAANERPPRMQEASADRWNRLPANGPGVLHVWPGIKPPKPLPPPPPPPPPHHHQNFFFKETFSAAVSSSLCSSLQSSDSNVVELCQRT